jgi:hypothetical protein
VTRGIAALFVLFTAPLAWAQVPNRAPNDDFSWGRSERAQARQEWRERREEARERRRERMGEMRERFRGDGVHLRIFRDYSLPAGQTANEPVVVIGGSARIDGRVTDDVVVVGGGLHLGPQAVIEGNAVSVIGEVTLEPGASVQGTIDEAVLPGIRFDPDWETSGWATGLAFWGSVVRLSLTMIVAALLTLLAPGWIASISSRSAGASILTGLAVEVLFVPALAILAIGLIVSIIGIPLLAGIPFLLAAFCLLWIAGFTGVAVRIGRTLRGRGSMPDASVMDFLIGYAIIIGVTVFGQLMAYGLGWLSPVSWPMRSAGLLVEYVAWTIGLGAAVTSLFSSRRIVPPPVPA